MKIVHIIPSLENPGGAESLCVNLVIALSNLGFEVSVITLYNNINFYKNKLERNNITYYCLNKRAGLDIANSLKLKQLIKQIRPNIVHSHLNTYLSFLVGGIYNNKNMNFFHTIHFSMSENTKPNFFITQFIKFYEKKGRLKHIAISHEVKKCYLKYMKTNSTVPIIYNGLPIKEYSNNLPLSSRKKDFICVANFSNTKNHLVLLEAFKMVVQKEPNTSLTLVGDGLLRSQIETKINNLSVQNNVYLLGKRNDVNSLLLEHKFFVLPSIQEGNPISVLEAMAAGLVILVTKYGGPKDVIIERENGFLLDPFSTEQIAATMLSCLKDKDLNEVIQKNNLRKIKDYDILKTAEEHLKLYSGAPK